MQQLTRLKENVGLWRGLSARIKELLELLELARAESDQQMGEEIAADAEKIAAELGDLEFRSGVQRTSRCQQRHSGHPCRGRRHRIAGLGGDVAAHVPALG